MVARADRFEYETDTSSLSDYDSEWTQISGADDDSDFPPLSAASERSVSPTGTVDGSVNGDLWEGLVDELQRHPSDYSDETPSVDRAATNDPLADLEPLTSRVATYIEEDSRVNKALDCSVVGTLRASRSRSVASSLHASMTESQSRLRLSFPDPLISPRDDRDTDADVEPISLTRASTPTSAVDETYEEAKLSTGASSFASIKAPDDNELDDHEEGANAIPDATAHFDAPCALTLSLYGSASPSKWFVAERVMALALRYAEKESAHVEEGRTRLYSFESSHIAANIHGLEEHGAVMVRVLDRTSVKSELTHNDVPDGVPSLAIILLPSCLPPVLPKHTRYLPLISPPSLNFGDSGKSPSSSFSEQVMRDTAQYAWKCLEVPTEDVINLDDSRPDAIIGVTALQTLDDSVLTEKLSSVFKPIKPVRGRHYDKHYANKWYSFAFVAATVLAATVGGTALRNRSAGGISVVDVDVGQSINHTISSLASANDTQSIVLRPETQAVLHTSTSSLATAANDSAMQTWTAITTGERPTAVGASSDLLIREKADVAAIPSTSTALANCDRNQKVSTWQEKLSSNVASYSPKELMKRPVTALRAAAKDSRALSALVLPQPVSRTKRESRLNEARPSASPDKGKGRAIETPALTSFTLIDAASTAFARLTGHRDMDELNAALDDLLQALGQQIDTARVRAKAVRGEASRGLAYRNERARERARTLRRTGENLLRRAGERLKGKQEEAAQMMQRARLNARKMRQEARELRRAARQAAMAHKNEAKCALLKLKEAEDEDLGEETKDLGFLAQIEKGRRRAEHRLRKLMASCEEMDTPVHEPESAPTADSDVEHKTRSDNIFGAVMDAVF